MTWYLKLYFHFFHEHSHPGETPYACNICGKSFTFQQSYHKHMLYHTDDKPYSCSQCGRAFKELSTLQNHERIHSGERPFACETCGKSFRQRVSYLVHRYVVHNYTLSPLWRQKKCTYMYHVITFLLKTVK